MPSFEVLAIVGGAWSGRVATVEGIPPWVEVLVC